MSSMNATQHFAAPKPLAMSYFEATRPAPRKTGLFDAILERLIVGTKAVQYAKMVRALSDLSDDQLAQVGIERAGIAAHAQVCIYGE